MSRSTIYISRFFQGVLLLVMSAGCGGGSLAKDDLDRGQEAVRTALAAWQKREPLKKFQAEAPTIQINEPDWDSGLQLLDFNIQRTEGVQGTNARCWVVLDLKDRKGKKISRDVVYEINLTKQPTLVIGRDPFN